MRRFASYVGSRSQVPDHVQLDSLVAAHEESILDGDIAATVRDSATVKVLALHARKGIQITRARHDIDPDTDVLADPTGAKHGFRYCLFAAGSVILRTNTQSLHIRTLFEALVAQVLVRFQIQLCDI